MIFDDNENGVGGQWEAVVLQMPTDRSVYLMSVYGVPVTRSEAKSLNTEAAPKPLLIRDEDKFGAGEFTREI